MCSTCGGDYFDQLNTLLDKYRKNNFVGIGDVNARTGSLMYQVVECEGSQSELDVHLQNSVFDLLPLTKSLDSNGNEYGRELKGLAQDEIIKKSVILFWLLNMTI